MPFGSSAPSMTMLFHSAALDSAAERRRSGMMFNECVSPPWQREQYTRYGSAPASDASGEKISSGTFGGGAGPGPGGSVPLPSSSKATSSPVIVPRPWNIKFAAVVSTPPPKPSIVKRGAPATGSHAISDEPDSGGFASLIARSS